MTPCQRDKTDIEKLNREIHKVVTTYDDDAVIDPDGVATHVIASIDDHLRYIAAHLEIRQLTRAILRRAYEVDPETQETRRRQPSLPNLPLVQDRYPKMPYGHGYIKRDLMTKEDWRGNVDRLRGKGGKLIEHADQLEEWGRDRYEEVGFGT